VGELGTPRPLAATDNRLDFNCGDEAINLWFRGSAWRSHTTRTSRVYVVLRDQSVAGFYALANSAMNRKHLPPAMQDKLPRHPIPLVLLARLGVSVDEAGQGLGGSLVKDAVLRSLLLSEQSGAVGLVVHAGSESITRFYQHLGFEPAVEIERTLVFPLSFE
jgi:GNAT superfamily N-acetyltransferase